MFTTCPVYLDRDRNGRRDTHGRTETDWQWFDKNESLYLFMRGLVYFVLIIACEVYAFDRELKKQLETTLVITKFA